MWMSEDTEHVIRGGCVRSEVLKEGFILANSAAAAAMISTYIPPIYLHLLVYS